MRNTKTSKNTELTVVTKTNTKHFAKHLIIKIAALTVVATSACASFLGGFNRNTATGLIEKDKRYTTAATMTIDIRGRIANAGADTPQKTANETVEEAAIRVKQDFMQKQPQLLAAENMGYIKLFFEDGELGERTMGAPRFDDALKHWYFKPRAEITEKGKSLWNDLNLNIDEKNLPLAIRANVEITGLKDESQQTLKSAEFTYRWKPNELGKAFDPDSNTFKSLPPDLQEALKKVQVNMFGGGSNNTMDFKTPRKGRATFQKFDDGWRLSELYFM